MFRVEGTAQHCMSYVSQNFSQIRRAPLELFPVCCVGVCMTCDQVTSHMVERSPHTRTPLKVFLVCCVRLCMMCGQVTSHMIECPPHLIGLLIGRGGSTIKRIKVCLFSCLQREYTAACMHHVSCRVSQTPNTNHAMAQFHEICAFRIVLN